MLSFRLQTASFILQETTLLQKPINLNTIFTTELLPNPTLNYNKPSPIEP